MSQPAFIGVALGASRRRDPWDARRTSLAYRGQPLRRTAPRAAATPQGTNGDSLGDSVGQRISADPRSQADNSAGPFEFQDESDPSAGPPESSSLQSGSPKPKRGTNPSEKPSASDLVASKTNTQKHNSPSDAKKSVEIPKPAGKTGASVASSETTEPTSQTAGGASSVKLSPGDSESAQPQKEKSKAIDEKQKEQNASRMRGFLEQAGMVLTTVGEKAGIFRLGSRARDNVEGALDRAQIAAEELKSGKRVIAPIPEGEKKPLVSEGNQIRLKGGAAVALRKVSGTVGSQWRDKLIPAIQGKLPREYDVVEKTAYTSAAITLACAFLLAPAFVGGGDGKMDVTKKDVSVDTTALEKKLDTKRSSRETPKPTEKPDISSPFPPDIQDSQSDAVSKVAESLPTESAPATPAIPAKGSSPAKQAIREDSPAVASIKIAVGSRASLIEGGSPDSLAPESTFVLEVNSGFRKLSAADQKSFAEGAYRKAQTLGYDAVSVVKSGSIIELAHAGIDVDLEDEAANLRAELRAMQRKVDAVATRDAELDVQLDALRERMSEQRDELDTEKTEIQMLVKAARVENAELAEELREARRELSQMPDTFELEKRTESAEAETKKMAGTVEMLSRQVTVARDEAKTANLEKTNALEEAAAEKKSASAKVQEAEDRVQAASVKFEKEAESRIKEIQAEAEAAVKAANSERAAAENDRTKLQDEYEKRVLAMESDFEKNMQKAARESEAALKEAQKSADNQIAVLTKKIEAAETANKASQSGAVKDLEDLRNSMEKSFAETLKAKDAEMKAREATIQDKYEKLLEEVRKKGSDEIDRLGAQARSDKKALESLQRSAEKDEADYMRDKVRLAKRVDFLEGKLKAAGLLLDDPSLSPQITGGL